MLHYTPQHVSSSTLLIIRRTNCITTASGIVTLCKQPYSMLYSIYTIWTTCIYIIFVFFYCRYNPLWVLALSVILFHSAREGNINFCAWVVLVMFLKLKEFGGISSRSEESVSLSIVRVGPYLDCFMVCIPPFIDYLFRVKWFCCFFILIYFRSRCSLFLSVWWITLLFVFGLLILILTWNWISVYLLRCPQSIFSLVFLCFSYLLVSTLVLFFP